MKLFITSLFVFLLTGNVAFSQDTEEEKKIKALEVKIEQNQQEIKQFNKSIDSLKVIASKKKFESLDGKGIACKVNMTGRVKSTPEVFGKEMFQIPNKKTVQVISYVSHSDNYYRVLYEGKFGFMSGIYFSKECDLEFLKKQGIPYDKKKDFLGEDIRSPNLTLRKNNLFATGGFSISAYGAGIQYERMISKNGFYLRTGYHRLYVSNLWSGGQYSYVIIPIGVTYLAGKKKSFELGAGVSHNIILEDTGIYKKRKPAPYNFAIGKRWKKPSGFLFRLGFGYPELIYFSLGYSF
jgi:hypothetical protein